MDRSDRAWEMARRGVKGREGVWTVIDTRCYVVGDAGQIVVGEGRANFLCLACAELESHDVSSSR